MALVSATNLETDVNEQLIIRASCTGENAVSEITIYSGTEIIPENIYSLRDYMIGLSATDFVYTTSFWEMGTYRAEIECTYGDGIHSTQTVMITVTPPTNVLETSTYMDYDYEALMNYNVFFKEDPTAYDTLLFQMSSDELTFQPGNLELSSTTESAVCENKTQKALEKRAIEDARLIEQRAREDAKIIERRAKEDAKMAEQRAKEDAQIAKHKCKKNDVSTITMSVVQQPINNGFSFDGRTFVYTGVYGTGLDLQYKVNEDYLKEELIIADVTSLPAPTDLTGEITLSLKSMMTSTTNHIIVDGAEWNMQTPITTSNKILIKDDAGAVIYQLDIPVAFDAEGANVIGTYTLTNTPLGIEVSVNMPYSWFVDAERVYPVYLDPTIVWDGTSSLKGEIPKVVVSNFTIAVGVPFTINEIIMWGNDSIIDAECELDIIDVALGSDAVDFRSFFNNQGVMEFTWTPITTGEYILSQYCWRGDTLDLRKIYSNSTITVI